ncbi:MAG: hypothetical protein IH974_11950 [Myxococcales bacterium]|nr:hypothetical protein [Myxococcales bacterium]
MYKLFITIIFIAILAQPIGASAATSSGTRIDDVPVVMDVIPFRFPLGIIATATGFVLWVVTTPIQAITRPTDMHKTFKTLVINPARFTWVDPLGHHPNRVAAARAGEIE